MTRLDRSSVPLFDADAAADPGFSFFDWILHADVGVHNAHVLRARYRRRIHLPMRETAGPCAPATAAASTYRCAKPRAPARAI